MQASREEQAQVLSSIGMTTSWDAPWFVAYHCRIEHEELELRKMLEDRQRTALLLSILERKEKIRNDRFIEISNLLEELR